MNSVNGRQPFSEIPKAKTLIGFGVGQELFYGMGALLNSQVTMYSTDLKKFNTVTNLWTAVSDFPAIGRGDAFTFCCNGLAYVEMGSDITTEFNETWMYDPSNNSWTQKSNFPGQFKSNGFGFVLNGKFYLGGGFSVSTLTVYSDLWEYDPLSDVWISKASLPGKGFYNSAFYGSPVTNQGYVMGGLDSTSSWIDSVYKYDPIANN